MPALGRHGAPLSYSSPAAGLRQLQVALGLTGHSEGVRACDGRNSGGTGLDWELGLRRPDPGRSEAVAEAEVRWQEVAGGGQRSWWAGRPATRVEFVPAAAGALIENSHTPPRNGTWTAMPAAWRYSAPVAPENCAGRPHRMLACHAM
jgi:hypothetical protein